MKFGQLLDRINGLGGGGGGGRRTMMLQVVLLTLLCLVHTVKGGNLRSNHTNETMMMIMGEDHYVPSKNYEQQSENGINDGDFHDEMQDTFIPQSIDNVIMTETNITSIFDSTTTTTIENDRKLLNIYTRRRWKIRIDGRVIVPYTIDNSIPNGDKNNIRIALDELEARTGCLKFIQRTNQPHYIKVTRGNGFCSSQVGTFGGEQRLSLGTGCTRSKGIIQHEFIHALGFTHEQNRPDRNTYVTYFPQNLISNSKANNFRKADGSTTLGSPYDFNSVMHYGAKDFGKRVNGNRLTVLVTKNGEKIGQRDGASVDDIKKLKLLYQCENGPRNWNSLKQSPCTSKCRCKNEEIGCGSNNDACQGSLVCSNNKCGVSAAPTPSPPPPPPPSPSSTKYLIYNKQKRDGTFYCFDLFARGTSNGNKVWYYPCNFSDAQYWYRDSNNYFRSSIDKNKCIVGVSGKTELGTKLMIYDCFENDDRFKWDYYTDDSIRPRNNNGVCIEQQFDVSGGAPTNLILDKCNVEYKEFGLQASTSSRRRKLTPAEESLMPESLPIGSYEKKKVVSSSAEETSSLPELLLIGGLEEKSLGDFDMIRSAMVKTRADDNCEDFPMGWYDIMGRNCGWYSEDESNCEVYGDSYKNFGKTALSACCVCGGGPIEEDDVSCDSSDGCEIENEQGCWDQPDWYDSTGDGCRWYSEESNYCDDYGSQFASEDYQTAKNACCVCGGGLSEAPVQEDESIPGCSNSPYNWFDSEGYDCSWYAEKQICVESGNEKDYNGLTAKESCCACGGGSNPSDEETCADSDELRYKKKKKNSCKWLGKKNKNKTRKLCKKKWKKKKLSDWCPETCGKVGVGKC